VSIEHDVLTRCTDPVFREWVADLLVELCAVDTTPSPDVAEMVTRESAVFDIISRELGICDLPGVRLTRPPISPAIAEHPGFTPLHHTKTPDRPEGLTVAEAFAGRTNLLFLADGPDAPGHGVAVNAHVDVVAPFVPPRRDGDRIHGRGSADDKGGVVAIIAAIRIIDELVRAGSVELRNTLTAMFVIEEETGGNGSLSLVIDRALRERYDSLVIFDTATNRICPANRGAVWFATEIHASDPDISPLLATAWAILAMQREGDAIKAESDHPLFPHRPVQTCNGMLGPFGEHPSRICGEVTCTIRTDGCPDRDAQLRAAIDRGITSYVDAYGDRTQEIDPGTGRVKVDHHVDITRDGDAMTVTLFGSTGHMGALAENDAAITKWAYVAREVALEEISHGRRPDMSLPGADADHITLEGGQGFLPTHEMDDVRNRMRSAFHRGITEYAQLVGADTSAMDAEITYDKLNNPAFAGDPDSQTVRNLVEAARAAGGKAELRGFDVSCDARLFANEYPELAVVTTGPGELRRAHSDDEYVDMDELQEAVAMCAIFLLRETGSLPATPGQ
jgi:acetylornithine deacetylase/succinyl-diaminopimelate desuccinylase-like protein